MRVLVWQWGRSGGGPRYAYELSRALRVHCGIDCFLSMAQQTDIFAHVDRSAVNIPASTYDGKFGFLARSLRINKYIAPIISRVRALEPQIALNAMPAYWDLPFARRLQQAQIPFVTIIHDATAHPGDNYPFFHTLQRRMIMASSGIVTLSNFVAERLRDYGSLKDVPHTTIPHVVFDFEELKLPAPKIPDYQIGRPLRLLLIGKIKSYKGLKPLTEALQLLSPAQVQLRIAGTIEERHEADILQQKFDAELRPGWLTDTEVFANIDWADVVIFPYIEASQSGTIPAAYKRARPVVVTPVGGLPEQVENGVTGLVTESASASAIAKAITAIIQDPALLRSCAQGALRLATNGWSWPQIAPRFAAFLSEVAKR